MLTIKGNSIYLTRGDNCKLHLKIRDINGEKVDIIGTTSIVLSVKSDISSESYLLQKTVVNSTEISILPADTALISYGRYIYDVQLTNNEGEIYTIIPPSPFIITEEVTS